jgi:hypothetical protein
MKKKWKCPYLLSCRIFCNGTIDDAKIHECKGIKAYKNFVAYVQGKAIHYEV